MSSEEEPHRLRLTVLDSACEVVLPMPPGDSPVAALLPAARAIVDAVADAGGRWAETQRLRVSCGPRCSACCRQVVPISLLEAASLVAVIASLPEPRRTEVRARFADAVARMEHEGLLDPDAPRPRASLVGRGDTDSARWLDASRRYFAMGVACPFLENDCCSIYAERPLVCREYLVTSPPERCASLDGGADPVPRPVDGARVLAVAASRLAPAPTHLVHLALALEWSAAIAHAFDASHDGEAMLGELVRSLVEADAPGPDPV